MLRMTNVNWLVVDASERVVVVPIEVAVLFTYSSMGRKLVDIECADRVRRRLERSQQSSSQGHVARHGL
jgi:hypothetical protein